MFQIALLTGNFETALWILQVYPSAFDQLNLTLESMSVFHMTLVSAFTVSQSEVAEKEPIYLGMIQKLLQAQTIYTGGPQDINAANRLG